MSKKIYLFFLFFSLIFVTAQAQIKPGQLKANWIYIIAENVSFPNDNEIDTIKIAVYGKNSDVYDYALQLSKEKKVNNKPSVVDNATRISQLEGYNIVYVDESKNDFVESIYNKIKGTGTLLITYEVTDQNFFMINLLLKGIGEQFQIQSSNLYDEKIIASEKLLSLGGTKVDLQGLFDKKVVELDIKEKELKNKENLLRDKEDELNILVIQIDEQKLENEEQTKLLEQKEKELVVEQQNAQKLLEEVARQETLLKKNQATLAQQNVEIDEKKKLIVEQNSELDAKKEEIENKQEELNEQQKRIDEQKATLNIQSEQIDVQKQVITIISAAVVIFLLLLILILRSHRINKRINRELKAKNIEIESQKDEITKQAEQLEEFNQELAKLSLVASQTDNSVIIMDKASKFEWVNTGFTRMYGYTLQLLLNERGDSLISISDNSNDRNRIIKKCIDSKKTQVYEAKNNTRTGEDIWVQTSLTPVLDENEEVIKLIAIESDITMLKEQEQEIKQKNEELSMQKAELQAQKDMLEEVNLHIKDSINYALTIQKSILPVAEDINKHFDNFLIYLPRDIVSGDFYWFSNPEENTFFFAAVDCTGHGVPGAFMSLISSRMLDEIVTVQKIYEPKRILSELNKMIIYSLSQETTNNRDGMDLSLARIVKTDSNDVEICFAGAKRPLIYYSKEQKLLDSKKGNRRSIGGLQSMLTKFEFEQEQVNLKKGDIIYLSSDGMIDQNDAMRKRFGTPKFMEIIEKIVDNSLEKQKFTILKEFENFKKDEIQRDDIIVWGIKL
ncbi:MAG: DUF4154 domain-containing protein [Bacteroidales bacterium]|nr:DUF4154 domain-containing protein [Bacteroidales bacterium]